MTVDGPDPGRLAAIDQELASLDAKLNRYRRIIMWLDTGLLAVALIMIGWQLAGGPPLSRAAVVTWLAIVAAQAAGDLLYCRRVRDRRRER